MFISLALNWETFVGRCAGLIAPDMISLSLGQVCEAHNLFAADIPSIKRRRGKHIREQWMRGPAFVCACRWEWERKTPQRIMKIYRCFNFCSFRFLSPTQTTTLGENFKCKQWLMGINGRRQPKNATQKIFTFTLPSFHMIPIYCVFVPFGCLSRSNTCWRRWRHANQIPCLSRCYHRARDMRVQYSQVTEYALIIEPK